MNADKILKTEKVGDIFTNNINKIKSEYKELAKIWHPDRNSNPSANEVFNKITELYEKGITLIEDGKWEKTNYILIPKENGKKIGLNYDTTFKFELGICYISKTKIVYLLDNDKEKYYNNAIKSIKSIKYKDSKMENDLSRFIPKLYDDFKTKDGKYVLVMNKTEEVMCLKDVFEHFDNKIDDKHVAWILSRLYNLACFMKFNGLVHNGINTNNCFVSPKYHSILLIGGWWYTTKDGDSMIGTTKDILSVMSVKSKSDKKSNSLTDLESIKLLGRQLLGGKKPPKPFEEFLKSGSTNNSYKEFSKWDEALEKSYGKRKFIKMEI